MRLGGPVFRKGHDPDVWIHALKESGYRAAYCPVTADAGGDVIRAYADAARKNDIIIAEVGVWSNPLGPDEAQAKAALDLCQKQLALADEIGAVCCVNISGSRGSVWDGPHPQNLTTETFDRIVEQTRRIIDAVKPARAFFTLEPMPWAYPDSPDSYLALLRAIDRKQFGVHLDPVNMVCSPQRYFSNADLLRECFQKLGPYIKSCHAKDILLSDHLTTHLDEARPGLGYLDYSVFLSELSRLPEDTPILLEHLQTEEDYREAAGYVRSAAGRLGIQL